MVPFNFENLIVWQKSRDLVKLSYAAVGKFPKHEVYGLSDQIRRASISVASNIAEGAGRLSAKEKAHFCEIAYGSLMEYACQIILANDLGYIDNADAETIKSLIQEIAKMLNAYTKVIKSI